MTRLIREADFEAITKCVQFKEDANFKTLESDLCKCLFDEACWPNFTPPPSKQRDLLKDLLKSENDDLAKIQKLYGFTNENEWGDEYQDINVPADIEPIIQLIEDKQVALSRLLTPLSGKFKRWASH